MSLVEIKNLEHRYGNHTVLAGLNLTLEARRNHWAFGTQRRRENHPHENPLRSDSEL